MARHALLVGVTRFKDTRLAALNAPANDVQAFADILRDPARGGFASVTVSVDDDFLSLRDRLSALFNQRDPDDLLLLYYSGHGILRTGNRLYLATPETDFDQPQARGVASSEIRDLMDQTRAERQVMVLDCCHSGAFAPGAKGAGATAVTDDTFGGGSTGRYVLTASDAQQFAWDGDRLASGDAATRTLSHFTSWLVDGLGRAEAAPDDPDISMDALFRYICRRAKADGSPATPQRFVDRGSDDFIIARNPAAAGSASVQSAAAQLESADWAVRLAGVEALSRLARSAAMRDAACDALADRLGAERDFKVRAAMLRALELPADPPAGSEKFQFKPEPPPAGANEADVSAAQRMRGELEMRAARNARFLWWGAWVSVVADFVAIQMVTGQFDKSGGWLPPAQIFWGGYVLLSRFWNRPVAASPGVHGGISVTRSGFTVYETARLRRACWVFLIAGLVALPAWLAAVGASQNGMSYRN